MYVSSVFGNWFELVLEVSDSGFVDIGLAGLAIVLNFHAHHLYFLPIDFCPAKLLPDFRSSRSHSA